MGWCNMHYLRVWKTGSPDRVVSTLEDRFWKKVDKSGECWVWTGGLDHQGYGKFGEGTRKGRTLIASRVAYELQIGSIPDGEFVLHRCDNPPCVRGSHLFLGPQSVNLWDMVAKGRHGTKDKPECKNGHAYTPENILWWGKDKPHKVCRKCQEIRNERRRKP